MSESRGSVVDAANLSEGDVVVALVYSKTCRPTTRNLMCGIFQSHGPNGQWQKFGTLECLWFRKDLDNLFNFEVRRKSNWNDRNGWTQFAVLHQRNFGHQASMRSGRGPLFGRHPRF